MADERGEEPRRWVIHKKEEVEEEDQEGDEHELDIDSTVAEGCSGDDGGASAREEPQDQDEGADEWAAWFKYRRERFPEAFAGGDPELLPTAS